MNQFFSRRMVLLLCTLAFLLACTQSTGTSSAIEPTPTPYNGGFSSHYAGTTGNGSYAIFWFSDEENQNVCYFTANNRGGVDSDLSCVPKQIVSK